MRAWLVLPLALAVAVPTHLMVRGAHAREDRGAAAASLSEAEARQLASIQASLATLQAHTAALSERVGSRMLPASDIHPDSVSHAEIEAAARAWLAARAQEQEERRANRVPAPKPLGETLSLSEIRSYLGGRTPFDSESQLLYEELRKADRMQDLVAAAQLYALDHPDDPEAQVSLGMASLQSLFGMDPSPEAGLLAMQADGAFSRALELDPKHLNARWAKAVSLSNWPTFMGKTPEAIEHFEILIRQTSAPGAEGDSPQAHAILGNLYERTGEREAALAAWRKGLQRFPNDEELLRQIALAEGTVSDR